MKGAASPPPAHVVKAFAGVDGAEAVSGGEGRCWRAGWVILKPCDSAVMWEWLAEHLPTVKPEGFRLPLPVPARDGRWIIDGWCAQESSVKQSHCLHSSSTATSPKTFCSQTESLLQSSMYRHIGDRRALRPPSSLRMPFAGALSTRRNYLSTS